VRWGGSHGTVRSSVGVLSGFDREAFLHDGTRGGLAGCPRAFPHLLRVSAGYHRSATGGPCLSPSRLLWGRTGCLDRCWGHSRGPAGGLCVPPHTDAELLLRTHHGPEAPHRTATPVRHPSPQGPGRAPPVPGRSVALLSLRTRGTLGSTGDLLEPIIFAVVRDWARGRVGHKCGVKSSPPRSTLPE